MRNPAVIGPGARLSFARWPLSSMLLVGAGLMIRSLFALRRVDPGFQSTKVVTMTVPIPESAKETQRNRLYDEFLPQVRSLAGILSVGGADSLPLTGGGYKQPIVVEGRPAEVFALQPNVDVRRVTPGYIQAMRIPLVIGRDFIEEDTLGRKAVVLISESMARQFWPGENTIGKRLRISFTPEIDREVVGVVADVKNRGLGVLEPMSILYQPILQKDSGSLSLVVRSNRNPLELVSSHHSGLTSAKRRVARAKCADDGGGRRSLLIPTAIQHVPLRDARRTSLSSRSGGSLQCPCL